MSGRQLSPLHPRAIVRAFGRGLPANYWRLWSSTVAANLADGIVGIAVPLIAIGLTRSPAEIAAVTGCGEDPKHRDAVGPGHAR